MHEARAQLRTRKHAIKYHYFVKTVYSSPRTSSQSWADHVTDQNCRYPFLSSMRAKPGGPGGLARLYVRDQNEYMRRAT